jgi:hypothetical protein
MSVRIVNFSDGFVATTAPLVSGAEQENYVLSNNQSLTNITGLSFDSSLFKSIFFDFEIERIGTTTYRQSGSLIAAYNGSWSITFGNYQGDTIVEDTLVNGYNITLSIDGATGQIKYSSGNQVGHVSSKIKLYIVRVTT